LDRESAHFELFFSPRTILISVVRRFVTDFYREALDDTDLVSRMTLTTHELLENAVKCCKSGETHLTISVGHDPERPQVVIETRNRADACDLEALRARFHEMQDSSDAASYYQTTMRRCAGRTDGSGLGLARIWAEGDMSLSHAIVGDSVLIQASVRVPRPNP
jgi:anti-sigma regulatory factor (Ser/Thr protein kinase)